MEETTTAITAVKQEVQLRDWAAQIAAQQASGMTVQKWCAENGINPKTYYYHLRKLREKCVASAPAIVPFGVPKYTSSMVSKYPKRRRMDIGSDLKAARSVWKQNGLPTGMTTIRFEIQLLCWHD